MRNCRVKTLMAIARKVGQTCSPGQRRGFQSPYFSDGPTLLNDSPLGHQICFHTPE